MTPEKLVQSKIMAHLKKLQDEGHPLYYERRQAGGFAYRKGLPDVYFVYAGEHHEVEIKKLGGTMSTTQETWQRRFKQLGIPHICVDSITDFKDYIAKVIARKGNKK